MKKISLAIALVLMLSALAACGSEEEGGTTAANSTQTPAETTTAQSQAEPDSVGTTASSESPNTSEVSTESTNTPEETTASTEDSSATAETPATSAETPATSAETPAETTETPTVTEPEPTAPATQEDPEQSVPEDAYRVGSGAELAELFGQINDLSVAEDAYILLTADIDLSGYTDVSKWEPLYYFTGTLDGGNHTISGLNWNFVMANDGTGNMPDANVRGTYILQETDINDGNRAAIAALGLFFVEGENAVIKDLTFKDCSLNIRCDFNRNYQLYLGGIMGNSVACTFENVKLENNDLAVPANACDNQKYAGYAGLLAGNSTGETKFSGCSTDGNSSIDATANIKYDIAAFVGRHESASPITFSDCSTAASVHAAEDVSDTSGMKYTGQHDVGGIGAAFVARFGAEDTASDKRDSFTGCTNTGDLKGAMENETALYGTKGGRTEID